MSRHVAGRPEADRLNASDKAPEAKALRPRDAATLLILDRSAPEPRVLMGRRSPGHVFMPGKFVFPGGRTDPRDARVPTADNLETVEQARIAGRGRSSARARAIALSALREAWEEVGVLIGRPAPAGHSRHDWDGYHAQALVPSLSPLRLVARAVTPPGAVRRFDTRFLAVWRDELAVETGQASGELEELAWLTLDETSAIELPDITRIVLDDLRLRLEDDPRLAPGGGPAFFYRVLHGRFGREPI